MSETKKPTIWRGDKVELRAKRQEDVARFVEDALADDMRLYGDGFVVHPASPEDLVARNESGLKYPTDDNCGPAVESHDGKLVGSINAANCNPQSGDFEYGVAIFEEYWRNGYAVDAVRILLRYYFEEKRYHRATAKVYSFNQASIALQEKLGFQLEGTQRESVFTKGKRYDTLLFGITASEFWDTWGKSDV